jgi:hypothetical protein
MGAVVGVPAAMIVTRLIGDVVPGVSYVPARRAIRVAARASGLTRTQR